MFEAVFIDFDETIFRCHDFKKRISDFFFNLGVSKDDYKKSYLLSRNTYSPHTIDYSFEEHIEILRNFGYDLDLKETLKELDKIFLEMSLVEGTEYFLSNLRKISKKIVLLSAGQKDFQLKKIKMTGVEKYFDIIKIIDGEKEKFLQENTQKDKKYLFINDSLKENILINNFLDNVTVLTKTDWKKYSSGDYESSQIPFFNTLTEILEYVQTKY